MYNNEYYLATYDKDEKNLLINSWTLCDGEYDAIVNSHICTSYSRYIMVDIVEKIIMKTKSGEYNVTKKNPYSVMQKVVQISTRYFDNQHLTLDMLQKNREKIQEIINNWKQSKNYKYVKEFIDIYGVQTYFGTDKSNFEGLLQDIDLYYIALDERSKLKK